MKSPHLDNAEVLINEITPSYFHEEMAKQVLEFQVKYLKQELTEADLIVLENIAATDYALGGFAVRNANALLPPCRKIVDQRQFRQGEHHTEEMYSTGWALTPNPTANFSILTNPDGEECLIEMVNTSGNVVQRFSSSGFNIRLDLTKEPSGLFLVRISKSNQRPQLLKLVKSNL